jgi:valyl-tRNA synthetase
MTKSDLIAAYDAYTEQIQHFTESHGEILNELERLNKNREAVLTSLKEECRHSGKDVETRFATLSVSNPVSTSIDYDKARKALPKPLQTVLDGITTVEKKVDKDKFLALVNEGVIPNEVRVLATIETKLTPRINLKEKDPYAST